MVHPDYERANCWTSKGIAAATEVHREKGPGLIQSIYEKCMMRQLELREIPAVNQAIVPIEYKGYRFQKALKLDVYGHHCLVVALKSVQEVLPIYTGQLLSYMKLVNAPSGLLINFHEMVFKDGISRLILAGADRP